MENDERFAHIASDPRFKRIPKHEQKVKIDKRFRHMFTDKNFKVKYTVDKRGRPVKQTSSEDLRRYYHLSSEDESEGSNGDESGIESDPEPGKFVRAPKLSSDDENETAKDLKKKDSRDKEIPSSIKKKLKNLEIDYARGEAKLFSESSSDESESEEESADDIIEHDWGELDKDAGSIEEATSRLAACHMDWDRIKASDLMVLFTSFLPPGGLIKSITIYPSEFGLERMKDEEINGPKELVENNSNQNDEDENEEGSRFHMEKLRQYQLNRLKYYYAVIVCDSPATANKIYTECDGMEYESSATKIDLRFIPEEMAFDQTPKEVCTKLPEMHKYEPKFFTNTALQQAKVELTWDETDPERIAFNKKLSSGKVDDITDADLQNYLASSSGEESEEEPIKENVSDNESVSNSIDKYKALLQSIEDEEERKKKRDVEMEVSWNVDLKQKAETLVKQKLTKEEEKTPFQQYLDKRKEKRKAKRQENKRKREHDGDVSSDDIPSDIDINDPYFKEEFEKSEFPKSKSKVKGKNNVNINDDEEQQAELELLLMDENSDMKNHFSLKKIMEKESKSKKKGGKADSNTDDFEINVKDDRFSALFSSHHFNIDPTDPHFRKTKAMEKLVEEKIKRRMDESEKDDEVPSKRVKSDKNVELNMLVKSVKRKTHAFGPKNTNNSS